jgi:hypothetical protein
MQFSERWLRTFVNPSLGSEELAHLLTMSGLEVNPASRLGVLSGVVGHIESLERHPNADRLWCAASMSAGELLRVVWRTQCGGGQGAFAPLAQPGRGDQGGHDGRGKRCFARHASWACRRTSGPGTAGGRDRSRDVRAVLGFKDHFYARLTESRRLPVAAGHRA